jgi:cytochrome P450
VRAPLQEVRRGTDAMQRTQDMARALLAHVKAGAPEPRSIAAHLLALADPTAPGAPPLADARLCSEHLTFLLAGTETTGHSIAWLSAGPLDERACRACVRV